MHAVEKAAKKSSKKRERTVETERPVEPERPMGLEGPVEPERTVEPEGPVERPAMLESHGRYIALGGPREKREVTLKSLNDIAAEKEKAISVAKAEPNLKTYETLGREVAQSLALPVVPRYFKQLPSMTALDLEEFCDKNQLNRPNPANKVDILYYVPIGVSLSHSLSAQRVRILRAFIDVATCGGRYAHAYRDAPREQRLGLQRARNGTTWLRMDLHSSSPPELPKGPVPPLFQGGSGKERLERRPNLRV